MAFRVETQTLKGILTAIYFILTSEILSVGAGQGEEEFSTENACVNLVFIAFCIGALQLIFRPVGWGTCYHLDIK